MQIVLPKQKNIQCYFLLSGGRESLHYESRILKNPPKVATYDLQPEMECLELTDALIPELYSWEADFVCLNFANGDMVGTYWNQGTLRYKRSGWTKCVEK
jgi:2,3-bisphosphoglycerate-independent phosphoglycerate mutase